MANVRRSFGARPFPASGPLSHLLPTLGPSPSLLRPPSHHARPSTGRGGALAPCSSSRRESDTRENVWGWSRSDAEATRPIPQIASLMPPAGCRRFPARLRGRHGQGLHRQRVLGGRAPSRPGHNGVAPRRDTTGVRVRQRRRADSEFVRGGVPRRGVQVSVRAVPVPVHRGVESSSLPLRVCAVCGCVP